MSADARRRSWIPRPFGRLQARVLERIARHLYFDGRTPDGSLGRVDDEAASVNQQLTDLADLKAATEFRHGLRPGTPEWEAAVRVEEDVIERIRHWVRPRRPDAAGS